MLDRTQAPPFVQNIPIKLPLVEKTVFRNGIQSWFLLNSQIEVFRLELIFRAGTYFGNPLGQSSFTSKMLLSGTKQFDANTLLNAFDSLGGFVNVSQNQENLTICLHGLSKYFENYLPIIQEILEASVLPEKELKLHKNVSLQAFYVENEKTSFLSSNLFRSSIFGTEHSFGKTLDEKAIEEVSLDDIKDFYKSKIQCKPFKVFLAGNVSSSQFNTLESFISNLRIESIDSEPILLPDFQAASQINIEKAGSVQSSVRFGKRLFNRSNPDYYSFMVMNIYLGGYFGSKLMKNIREEKGLTYGIQSSLMPLCGLGYFAISTDVKKENLNLAIDEINKEILDLKNVAIKSEELNNIKNYISGSVLGGMTTVFEVMDKHKSIEFENLPQNFYEGFSEKVAQVNANDIMEMANKYLIDLSVISVG